MKVVLVIGVFDLFHRGHVELLKSAASFGDRLVVVVNGDEFTARYKRRPIFNEDDRFALVSALRWVDKAEISNASDVKPFIEKWNVNVIVHGDDWDHASYLKQICVTEEYLQHRRIEMVYTPYYEGMSTSGLIRIIRGESRSAG